MQIRQCGHSALHTLAAPDSAEDRAAAIWLQVLRSIDSDSADGFPSHQAEAMQMGLDSGKGKIIDYSIQKVWRLVHHSAVQVMLEEATRC